MPGGLASADALGAAAIDAAAGMMVATLSVYRAWGLL
jgi:hypothetical protein